MQHNDFRRVIFHVSGYYEYLIEFIRVGILIPLPVKLSSLAFVHSYVCTEREGAFQLFDGIVNTFKEEMFPETSSFR